MTHDKFVYFDLGKVLVTFEHQYCIDQLASASAQPADLIQQTLFDSGLQTEYETGLVSTSEFANRVNQALGTQLDEKVIIESVSAIFQLHTPILPVLEYLRGKQIPMAVLSNTCEGHWQWILKQDWPIPGDWFQFHILSYEVQSMKPDHRIYEVCEERVPRTNRDIFFTDDREENIQAALERGWTTHLFQTPDALLQSLKDWIDA